MDEVFSAVLQFREIAPLNSVSVTRFQHLFLTGKSHLA